MNENTGQNGVSLRLTPTPFCPRRYFFSLEIITAKPVKGNQLLLSQNNRHNTDYKLAYNKKLNLLSVRLN